MSDRHLRILRAVARRRREEAVLHVTPRGDATATREARAKHRRASDADARLTAAEGRRRRPGAW